MKKIFLILIILHLSCIITYSQSGWFWQNPLPTGNTLYKVQYIDNNTGFAVGESRTFLKTKNGGLNWEVINVLVSVNGRSFGDFTDLNFINSSTGYVFAGGLFKTIDGGRTWSYIVPLGGEENLFSMKFLNENTGVVMGDRLLKTTDGGLTWEQLYTNNNVLFYNYAWYLDENNICLVCADSSIYQTNMILRSTNGGASWFRQQTNEPLISYLTRIKFLDYNNAYIIGRDSVDVYLLRTTNSGNNWSKIRTGYTNYPMDFYFNDMNTGIIVNEWRQVIRTSNGGMNWHAISFDDTEHRFYGIAGNQNNFILVGSRGRIYLSQNFGLNWNEISKATTYNNLWSVSFVDTKTGFTVGDSGLILKTTNAGFNWIKSEIDTPVSLRKVEFFGNDTGYISAWSRFIYKTTNAGINWFKIDLSPHGNSFKISFYNSTTGLAVGTNKYLKTTDGGLTWLFREFYNIESMIMVNPQFFIVTYGALGGQHESNHVVVSRTTNDGFSWEDIHSFGTGEPADPSLFVLSSKFGFMSGGYHTRLRTTNFFETSEDLGENLPYGSSMGSIKFIDTNNGLAYNGTILRTTNSGYNWYVNSNIANCLTDIKYIDKNTAVAVGYKGAIVRIENLSSNSPSYGNNIPRIFTLFQNYPNPFNPKTKIKFFMNQIAIVKLNIYNILGEKVFTVFEKELGTGEYQFEIDGLSLASGIYFYRLESGNYTESKKMVLIK